MTLLNRLPKDDALSGMWLFNWELTPYAGTPCVGNILDLELFIRQA